MMRKLLIVGIAALTAAISSCDEDTATLGYSLTDNVDKFGITTDTFTVDTRSLKVDSVLSRSSYSYLGCIRDPETGAYVTIDYMTQFNILENETEHFPAADLVLGRDADGLPVCDSCYLDIVVNKFLGDSLAAMKLMICELAVPITDNQQYYTSFDPEAEGYLRTDAGALRQGRVYSISDLMQSDSVRAVRRQSNYNDYIAIPLNKPYTDKDGNQYNNYGTYLMRQYYQHPEYYRNSITFANKVCPGLYIASVDGNGVISQIFNTRLLAFFHFKYNDQTYSDAKIFTSTEEVLQTTHISNDADKIAQLVADNSCTYLKTPAGVFTEVTLPVDSIKMGKLNDGAHLNDTIAQAKIVFQRMKSSSDDSELVLEEPTSLLMIERDSLFSFFENRSLPDYTTSFIASYNKTNSTYTFNNISTLVNAMWSKRNTSANWNKVVLVPVELVTASASSSSSSTVVGVNNAMSMSSVRLVGGSANQHAPVSISVIYNTNQ